MKASLILGIAYFGLASASVLFTRFDGSVGLIWGATALLTAYLFGRSPRDWAWPLLTCGVGNFIVIAQFGLGARLALPLTLVSLSEAVIAVALVRRWIGIADPLDGLPRLARFTVAIGLVAPACRAVLGLFVTSLFMGGSERALYNSFEVFTSHALGAVILTPVLLLISRRSIAGWWAKASWAEGRRAALLLSLVAAVSVGVFAQTRFPMLFLPLLPMQLAVFRMGRFGAAASLVILATVGGVLTLQGFGPVHLVRGDPGDRAWFLQFYLVTATLIALPSAAELSRRARLSRALAEAEQRHRDLAENSNDMIVRFDLTGVRTYVSPACRTMLGYEPHELLGATAAGEIHPDDRAGVIAICETLLEGAREPIATYRQRRKDGSYAWLEASYRLIHDPATDLPSEVMASVRDVAARDAAELERASAAARLATSHRLLSMSEQVGQIGHWQVDSASGSVFWSDVVCAIHGVASGFRPSVETAFDFYVDECRAEIEAHADRALRTGEGFDFDAWIARRDGVRRRVTVRGRADLAPNGETIGLIGVVQDVTDHYEMMQALKDGEARYRIIADRGGDIVLTIDVDGVVRYASPSVERLSGYAAAAIVGRTAQDFVWHEDVPVVVAAHFRAVRDPDTTEIFDYRVQVATGELRWFETHTRAIVDGEGRTTGVVSAMRDVTDRKQAEAELTSAANTDPLTGLANRRRFNAVLDRLLAEAGRENAGPSCLVMIDIDFFKQVNDRHGHDVGDLVLKMVADTIARETREQDLVARLGGEEFALLLSGAAEAQARAICERIRGLVRDTVVTTPAGRQVQVTISLGMSAVAADKDADRILREADAALYTAKHAGRNCLKLAA